MSFRNLLFIIMTMTCSMNTNANNREFVRSYFNSAPTIKLPFIFDMYTIEFADTNKDYLSNENIRKLSYYESHGGSSISLGENKNFEIKCIGKCSSHSINMLFFLLKDREWQYIECYMLTYDSNFALFNNNKIGEKCGKTCCCQEDSREYRTAIINQDLSIFKFDHYRSSDNISDSLSLPSEYYIDTITGFVTPADSPDNVYIYSPTENRQLPELNLDRKYFTKPRFLIPFSLSTWENRVYTTTTSIDNESWDSIMVYFIAQYPLLNGNNLTIVETISHFKSFGYISQIFYKEVSPDNKEINRYDLSMWNYPEGLSYTNEVCKIKIIDTTLECITYDIQGKEKEKKIFKLRRE